MRVQELLTERHEYEDIIQQASSLLADKLVTMAEKDELPSIELGDRTFRGEGELGKLKDLIGSKPLGKLYNRLGNTVVSITSSATADKGTFNRFGHGPAIRINLHEIMRNMNRRDGEEEIASTIAHELKHALDDSLSGRRVTGTKFSLRKPVRHASTDDYYSEQTEVNARLTQAAREIRQQTTERGGDISNDQLMDTIILPTLKKHRLADIFTDDSGNPLRGVYEIFGRPFVHRSSYPMDNKQFRKIVGRMYDYAKRAMT